MDAEHAPGGIMINVTKPMRAIATSLMLVIAFSAGAPAAPTMSAQSPKAALHSWVRMVLELVRHTATYSPPVASRSMAYLGVTAWEVTASGDAKLKSLAGQLNGLTAPPAREAGAAYNEAVIMQAAMAAGVHNFFANTGPTGQRALAALEKKLKAEAATAVAPDVLERSQTYGEAVAAHILAWSANDGGAKIENMGFPQTYELTAGPGRWVPTGPIRMQQMPLLPKWGTNRTFAMPEGATCKLPAPPAYSEKPGSPLYAEAKEVYDTVKALTPEQKAIARFWSDDPMLSPTPPGHWLSIALNLLEAENADAARSAELFARLGVTVADAFIGCWNAKFEYDLLRPVTYIKKVLDPKFEPLLITPPFPEYPSGHSTQSGAAEMVLASFYGDNFAFTDTTHEREGIKSRSYKSFHEAAQEAGISRLYGGIHFRSAVVRGLEQGRCIGAYATALEMR